MTLDKQQLRKLKREIKKDGNRKRRNYFKQQLRENPEEAHWNEYGFDGYEATYNKYDSTKHMNGMDKL